MKAKFGTPEHGWLSVLFDFDGDVRALDVSDAGPDSLLMLTNALTSVLRNEAQAEVIWYLEPEVEVWNFFRRADRIEVVGETRIGGTESRSEVFRYEATPKQILMPILSGLDQLSQDSAWHQPDQSSIWSRPFPFETLSNLSTQIEQAF
jgi:hypothetical protein